MGFLILSSWEKFLCSAGSGNRALGYSLLAGWVPGGRNQCEASGG